MTKIMAYQGDKLRKGSWLEEEDERLTAFATLLGERKWDSIAILSGLMRSGKSCRMRWLNYLQPNLKRGHISAEEEQIVIQLHGQWGNKWARIARRLPGRTDNEIKNYWRTHLRKKTREEGNSQSKVYSSKPELLYQNGDSTSAWKYSIRDYNSADDHVIGPTDFSLEHFELPCITYLNSSYETRLYDWIPKLSNDDQSQTEIHGEGNGLDWCFCDPAWNSEDCDPGSLDSLGSLWDMN